MRVEFNGSNKFTQLLGQSLIRQSENLEILTTEQCRGQGLNLRKFQAETLKQSLTAQQAQEQHVYINLDSNISDDEDTNGNSNEVVLPPYGDNGEVEGLGDGLHNDLFSCHPAT